MRAVGRCDSADSEHDFGHFGITGYYDPGRLRHEGIAKTPTYPAYAHLHFLLLCVTTVYRRYRQTVGRYARIAYARCAENLRRC